MKIKHIMIMIAWGVILPLSAAERYVEIEGDNPYSQHEQQSTMWNMMPYSYYVMPYIVYAPVSAIYLPMQPQHNILHDQTFTQECNQRIKKKDIIASLGFICDDLFLLSRGEPSKHFEDVAAVIDFIPLAIVHRKQKECKDIMDFFNACIAPRLDVLKVDLIDNDNLYPLYCRFCTNMGFEPHKQTNSANAEHSTKENEQ
jgi:hypothetical protein